MTITILVPLLCLAVILSLHAFHIDRLRQRVLRLQAAAAPTTGVTIDARATSNPAEVKAQVYQAIMEAMPLINQSAYAHTMRKLGRPAATTVGQDEFAAHLRDALHNWNVTKGYETK